MGIGQLRVKKKGIAFKKKKCSEMYFEEREMLFLFLESELIESYCLTLGVNSDQESLLKILTILT